MHLLTIPVASNDNSEGRVTSALENYTGVYGELRTVLNSAMVLLKHMKEKFIATLVSATFSSPLRTILVPTLSDTTLFAVLSDIEMKASAFLGSPVESLNIQITSAIREAFYS